MNTRPLSEESILCPLATLFDETGPLTREVVLDGRNVTIEEIYSLAKGGSKAKVDDETRRRLRESRDMLERLVEKEPIYGVTTGFGALVHHIIDRTKETALQTNVIRSQAACVGEPFTYAESRAIMAARLNALCRGYSAVREELVDRLAFQLNNGIVPVIPQIGSLGASGDLGPLSHLGMFGFHMRFFYNYFSFSIYV